jgi:branched-chain amino acid transport system permease protein
MIERTRIGMLIRAGASNRVMVSALGVNIGWLNVFIFALGGGLAGLAGALIVGLVDTLGRIYLPTMLRSIADPSVANAVGPALASIGVYLLMAIVLAFKPDGLFPVRRRQG